MKRFDVESFGDRCPDNWQEIIDYLNDKLTGDEDKNDMEQICDTYCNGGYPDAPEAVM